MLQLNSFLFFSLSSCSIVWFCVKNQFVSNICSKWCRWLIWMKKNTNLLISTYEIIIFSFWINRIYEILIWILVGFDIHTNWILINYIFCSLRVNNYRLTFPWRLPVDHSRNQFSLISFILVVCTTNAQRNWERIKTTENNWSDENIYFVHFIKYLFLFRISKSLPMQPTNASVGQMMNETLYRSTK